MTTLVRDRDEVQNFGPGPAQLPLEVLQQAKDELLSYRGSGMSVMEISHRSDLYEEIQGQAERGLRQLMEIPDDYDILFLQGGASLQFAMLPLNFLPSGGQAGYVLTGSWAEKAAAEASEIGSVHIAASTKDENYLRIPVPSEIEWSPQDVYLHITTNNTIVGSQWKNSPAQVEVPLVADMSSDICSRKIRVEDYHLIYAGAQKNLGPAGVTIVILKRRFLNNVVPDRAIPNMLRYTVHVKSSSRYNTPPVYAVYLLKLVVDWLLAQGGLAAIESRNEQKAAMIYDAIDQSDGFYRGSVQTDSRSRMNITFRLASPEQEVHFLQAAAERRLIGLAGHRSVGGVRVSLYNAVPLQNCDRLREFMDEYRGSHQIR